MAKKKDEIRRTDLNNSMLKRVIIRADFTPMLDLEATVSDINRQEWFRGKSNNYERRTLEVKKDEEQDNLEGQYVKRFDDCNIEPEKNVTLDIGSNFVCIDINCDEHYTQIDEYLRLMVNIVGHIVGLDNYVKMDRLAIRKTDGLESIEGKTADEVFEYFDQQIEEEGDKFTYRTYTDSFIYSKKQVMVHYNRTVRVIPGETATFIFVLDIDTYLERGNIENRRPNVDELWALYYERLNEASFDLFKRGVKEDYLNSIMKEQDE